jgi:hypothetical protein
MYYNLCFVPINKYSMVPIGAKNINNIIQNILLFPLNLFLVTLMILKNQHIINAKILSVNMTFDNAD